MRFWCRTHVVGVDNVAADRGGVFIVNHQSFLDPLFVAVRLTRSVSYLARDSLFKVPGSIRTALDRLEEGHLVGIYPEGTRSTGEPDRFKPGFLSLARRTEAPIYPVAVVGADKAMPKGAWFIRPARVTVVYGPPLTDEEIEEIRNGDDDRTVAEMMRQKVTALYRTVA